MAWTFQELQETFAGMPEGATLFQFNTSRDRIFAQLVMYTLESYVDREAGTCSFDSPGFRSMLEFSSQFPTKKEVEKETAAFADLAALVREAEERSMKGLQMLDNYETVTLAKLPTLNAKHGGQCAFVGYPTENGSVGGSFVYRGPCLAMSSACQNKEAVWEFFRMLYLSPNSTIRSTDDTVPVCKLLYDKQRESLMKESRWVSPFPFSQPDTVLAPPLTEEQVQRFEDFFNSVNRIDILQDVTLGRLVREVCAPYFSGDNTLDETVSLLDNRVGLYLSEQK